jgi:hypothetical protein
VKKLSIALFLLLGGCSSTHVNAPAPPAAALALVPASAPAAAPASGPLIPRGVAVTVEEDKPDETDSTLSCAALQGLANHGDTKTAFQNLNSASQTRAYIVGYGSDGSLCTGDGNDCQVVNTTMTPFDADDWAGFANSIQGKFSRLTVLGCNVGRGDQGAAFVTRLAEETKTRVRAPTALVWCQDDTLGLDPDNQWVEARPGKPARARTLRQTVPTLENYNLFLDGQWKKVPVNSVQIVKFSYSGFAPYKGGVVEPDEARSFLPLVDWGHPFNKHARPLAAVTGRIQLSVTVEGSHPVAKTLILYADSLVVDPEAKDFYYRTDSRLHEKLQKLRLLGPRPHGLP